MSPLNQLHCFLFRANRSGHASPRFFKRTNDVQADERFILDDENRRQFWVPRGFAHGFAVHSETADFFYKCDEFYIPADEKVLQWNDPALGIDWGLNDPILSRRDREGLTLAELSVSGLAAKRADSSEFNTSKS